MSTGELTPCQHGAEASPRIPSGALELISRLGEHVRGVDRVPVPVHDGAPRWACMTDQSRAGRSVSWAHQDSRWITAGPARVAPRLHRW